MPDDPHLSSGEGTIESSETVRTVGRYEILHEVGRGGMATVYLARQVGIERPVALKELAILLAGDPDWARRFLREARVAGSLSHPSIVTVHEYFEHEGVPYLSMEYLERGSLRGFMGALGVAEVGGIIEGVLAGLAHAESRGIVHRDLKPENLMVTSEGAIKIADFGIARAYGQAAPVEFKTSTGVIVGTPAYMSPEQAMGKDLGPWSDLYSVGVIAYELLADRVPFHAESDVVLLLRHVNEPVPPLLSLKPDLEPRLVAWVERLLEKDEPKRPQSAAEAWSELEEILSSILGPMWRRDARLLSPRTGDAAKPLTPAIFEKRAATAPDPSATAAATEAAPAAETVLDSPESRVGPAVSRPAFTRKRALVLGAVVVALVAAGVAAALLALGGGGGGGGGGSGPVSLEWRFQTGGLESSSPAVAGGRVVLGSQNRNVYAVDAVSGEQLWRVETGRIVFSSPAVASGVVYIGSEDRNVYALALGAGRELWRFQTGGQVHASPAVAGGTVYVGSDDGKVYALDAATGKARWRFTTGRPVQSSPAVSGGVVYVGGRDNYAYAIDAATGEKRWQFKTGAEIWSSPAVAGGTVFIGSSDHNLYALDAKTGKERWRYAAGDSVSSSPFVSGGNVYVGSFDRNVYALDAATGKKRWSFTTGDVVFSSPTVAEGVLYVGSHDHNLYALDAGSGGKLWSYELDGLVGSSPAAADGIVYVGSDGGYFYALRGGADAG